MHKAGRVTGVRKKALVKFTNSKIKSGEEIPAEPVDSFHFQGRNTPCGCGSGKKFKHCCRAIVVKRITEQRRKGSQ